jgi:hypothetical protein
MTIRHSPYLYNERLIPLCPSLAVRLNGAVEEKKHNGVHLALALQQLHYRLQIVTADSKHPNWHDGKPWFGQAWRHWQALEFPFWGESTIRGYFAELENMGLVEMRKHWSQEHDQRTYMTINWDHPVLQDGPVEPPAEDLDEGPEPAHSNGNGVQVGQPGVQVGQHIKEDVCKIDPCNPPCGSQAGASADADAVLEAHGFNLDGVAPIPIQDQRTPGNIPILETIRSAARTAAAKWHARALDRYGSQQYVAQLFEPVWADDGTGQARQYLSPAEMFDHQDLVIRERFRRWVVEIIDFKYSVHPRNQPGGQEITQALRGYDWQSVGWLHYMETGGKMHRPKVMPDKRRAMEIPGERPPEDHSGAALAVTAAMKAIGYTFDDDPAPAEDED